MIKTFAEFRHPTWQPTTAEMFSEVNAMTAWGKYVTDYITPKLKGLGFDIIKVYPEDWGYEIAVAFPNVILYVSCAQYEEYSDGFLLMINPTKSFVRKWFKKIDICTEQQQLIAAVDQILQENEEIYALKWWDEATFQKSSSI